MGLTQITTGGIKDLTITTADIAADAITNAKIANNAVTVDNLPTATVSESILNISNAGSNGQFLQKQSGNTGGLTWADVPAGVGGGNGADFNDNVKVRFGTGNDLELYHDGTWNFLRANNGNLAIQGKTNENSVVCIPDGKTALYYDNTAAVETVSGGILVTGVEGGNGHLYLYADEGDDAADKWLQLAYASGSEWQLRNYSNGSSWETSIQALGSGKTSLYYDNSEKFKTYSGGVEVTGLKVLDNNELKIGNAEDLKIFHDGNNSVIDNNTGDLLIRMLGSSGDVYIDPKNGDRGIKVIRDGAVELYYDGSKKFETSSTGGTLTGKLHVTDDVNFDSATSGRELMWDKSRDALVFKDNCYAEFGTGTDFQIYHNGTYNFIKTSNSNGLTMNQPVLYINNQADSERMIRCVQDAAVELYHNGTLRAQTSSWGWEIPNGNYLELPHDSAKIRMGASQDLEIFHDGTHSYVKDAGTGALRLQGSQWHVTNADASKYMVWAAPDAAGTNDGVYLYYNGTWRSRTTNTGLQVNGNLELTGSTGVDFSNNQGSQASGSSTTSEVLDHYEEGSWTPANGSRTGTGTFVRIGALVNCWGYINNISNSGGSSITITGLPYTNTGNGHVAGGILSDHNSEAGQNLVTYVGNNESQFYIYKCDSGNWSAVTHNDLNSSGNNMYFNLTYRHA